MSYNYYQQTIVPSTTAWSVGTVNNPFKDIWLSFGSINLANRVSGVTGIALSNENNYLTMATGTAGLQLRGQNNITTFQATSAGRVSIFSPAVSAGELGALAVIGNETGYIQPVLNPGVMLHLAGNDGQVTRTIIDAYGTGTYANIIGRTARGTSTVPSPTLSGDTLFRITANGFNSVSGFTIPNGSTISPTTIEAVATENFTTSTGTEWRFYNATKGDTAVVKRLDAVIDNKGITVPVASAGITFGDGTFQNTAFYTLTGTWIPRLSAVTPGTGFGYLSAAGNYTRNGQNVYATFSIALSSLDATAGAVSIGNLPYPVINGPGTWGDVRVFRFDNLKSFASSVAGGNEGSQTTFNLYYTDKTGGGTTGPLTVAELNADSAIYGAITYIAQ